MDALASIKVVLPHCSSSHYIFHLHALVLKKNENPVLLKNDFDGTKKVINFIKPQTSSTHLFNILCDIIGNTHKTLLLHSGK